jgi:hypothetical protein
MCTGLEVAVLALSAVSSITSAVGAVQQGKQQRQAYNYQAEVQEQQAQEERIATATNEANFKEEQRRLLARRRAVLGASGVELSSGSPLLVSEDFAGETALQALRIRRGGEVRATRLEQQANLSRYQGRAAKSGGYARAGSTLLSGLGKTAYYGSTFA